MKRIIKLSGFVLGLLMPMCVSAQMDNLANMSAKWIRANARNAALDGADIVNYNPAGCVHISMPIKGVSAIQKRVRGI